MKTDVVGALLGAPAAAVAASSGRRSLDGKTCAQRAPLQQSFPRKRESRLKRSSPWIPACAGMTVLVCLAVVCLSATPSFGQVATGFPPFGSFSGSSFDTVNDANLNVHFAIPVISKAGRGLPFNYSISHDSSVWGPSSYWVQGTAGPWGWSLAVESQIGSFDYGSQMGSCEVQSGYPEYYDIIQDFTYADPSGAVHSFGGIILSDASTQAPDCTGAPPSSGSATASDGSGYTMSATLDQYGNSSVTVTSPSGDAINPPLFDTTAQLPGWVTDPNGNSIAASVSGATVTFDDTLNTTALTVSGSGTPSSPATYAYTNPPPGGTSQVTVNYSTYTVQTNFGCSGISEFGATSENLVSSIVLPDGSSYTFTYEQTPGYSGSVTGRIASITLPTGGTISYNYSGGANDGINCSDGSGNYLERTTPDGVWTYKETGSAPATTTTVTDPAGNETAYQFQGIYETERKIYQGSSTLLETLDTCYNGATSPCTGTAITLPITERSVTVTLAGVSSPAETVTDYNSYGLPTETDIYDYGPTLARKTLITYASPGNNIQDRPASVTVENASSTPVAESSYAYDTKGNLLTLNENVTSSSTISRSFTYGTGGVLATATDFGGHQTSFTYGDCSSSFPTSIAQPLSLTSSLAWDCNTGLVTSVTDPNSQLTSFSYDDLYRLTQTNYPDGGQASTAYNDTSNPASVVTTTALGVPGNRENTAVLDGLGRVRETQLNSDPAGADKVDTTYDALGHVASVTNPYRTSSTGSETYSYDALNRVTKVLYADTDYSGAYYGAAVGANGGLQTQKCSGAAGYPILSWDGGGNYRQTWVDFLGRVVEVDEPDPSTNSLTSGNVNATCYSYDVLGNLTGIAQGGQTRSYSYDMLSRLISATTPESGTTTYSYSGCSGDPSNVCTRTDARGVTTTYAYDALTRLTSKSYSDGTPSANFYYDQASTGRWGSPSLGNPKGRLTSMSTLGGGSTLLTASVFSYDQMGRIQDYWQCTPYNCNSSSIWDMHYNYDLAGDVTSWTHPEGFTITNTINSAQEITQIQSSLADATHPQDLAKNITYTPWGAEQTLENGCASSSGQEQGCTDTLETYVYNNRMQPVMIELGNTTNASADYCLVYNYYGNVLNPTSCTVPNQGGYDGGNVTGVFYQDSVNPSMSHTAAYAYDHLNRLLWAKATGNSAYAVNFSYAPYGNRTCQTSGGGGPTGGPNLYCFSAATYSSATNQITNSGYTYDAAGDLTGDGTNTYQYDAEGREISVNGPSNWAATYNAFGQVTQRYLASQGETDSFIWDPSGRLSANWTQNHGWWWDEFVWANGAPVSDNRQLENTVWFLHGERLNSTKGVSTSAGALMWDNLYYPWGEDWEYAGSSWGFFAGMGLGWSAIGQIETPNRNYVPGQGRWQSPDPLGGDITNPQSLNRYAYVLNNPTTLTDPSGLGDLNPADPCSDPSYFFSHAQCSGPPPGGCVAYGTEGCIPPPIGFPVGGGGGGGPITTTTGTSTGSSSSTSSNGPLADTEIGVANGFMSTAQTIEQIGVYASPWEVEVLSICAGTPVCQDVLAGAVAGVVIYKGVQTGIRIYNSRKIAPNQAENAQVSRMAREFCVDPRALGNAIHDYKKRYGNFPLTQQEIEDLARTLPKTPGCTPSKE